MTSSETPTLTKQKQKYALSGKKQQQGHSLFVSPYDTYWPELDKNAEEDFNEMLLSALKPFSKSKVRLQWLELKKVPPDERRKMKMEHLKNHKNEGKSRESVCLGINAVTRGLNSSVVSSALVAKDADPKLLISHIITMCSIQGVPVLVVPALRNITKSALGFSCIALAFKRKGIEDLQELHNTIKSLSAKFPVPDPLVLYEHSLAYRLDDDEEEENCVSSQSENINISTDVYKYRTSKTERAFVPNPVSVSKPSTDFLALEKDVKEAERVSSKFRYHSYRPVRIKTLPFNPEKIRKKELKKHKK